jgi:hypothetical protein
MPVREPWGSVDTNRTLTKVLRWLYAFWANGSLIYFGRKYEISPSLNVLPSITWYNCEPLTATPCNCMDGGYNWIRVSILISKDLKSCLFNWLRAHGSMQFSFILIFLRVSASFPFLISILIFLSLFHSYFFPSTFFCYVDMERFEPPGGFMVSCIPGLRDVHVKHYLFNPLEIEFLLIIHIVSVHTSQEKLYVSPTRTTRLMIFRGKSLFTVRITRNV